MKNLTLLLILISMQSLSAQIKKIEPEFWWSGMKSAELQLLVYGENIQGLTPSFSDGIEITDLTKVENPNYLFVTINTQGVKPGSYTISFKKEGKTVQEFDYEFKKRMENSADRQGFDSSDVIYLIMPDRFANGNPDNDAEDSVVEQPDRLNPDGRHGGDLEGIIQHLDYLEELGVTAIWNTPLLEDNEPVTSYHGYAQSDYYRIDPRYGTNEDYRRLADELHKRDMKLIMDYVTNHWGSKHWIIQDLPQKDWINYWEDGENGFKRSNYRMTTQFDTNASQIDTDLCADGWFDVSMPDMNQRNPLVLNYMVQNAVWWIEYAGLDGLRVDTYSYNDKEKIAEWTKRVMDEYPHFNIVGEVWMSNPAHMAYWQKDSKVGAIQDFNSHLPSVMDFSLFDALTLALGETHPDWNEGMIRVYNSFSSDFLYPDPDNLLVFIENHDTNRFNHLYSKIEDYKLALSLIATVRGIPQIYYGSEIGMQGDKAKGDGDIRRDFPGGWPDDPQNAFDASSRTETQKEYFDFTKKLLNWRKNNGLVHQGKTIHFLPIENVYVYFRKNNEKTLMVILNNNPEKQTLELKSFNEGIGSFTKGKDVLTNKEFNLTNSLEIEGKTPLLLELE